MLPFSDTSARLAQPGSDVWAVHYDALARQKAGEDVILLSVGDPDFNTPPYISEYVKDRIDAGRTHYSPAAGEDGLREAIAELETNDIGYTIDPEQVVVFPGGTATLYAACACIFNPGDSIVVAEPMYVGYRGIVDGLGIELRTVPLAPPDFVISVDEMMAAVTTTTKALLINTPGNPCGNVIEPQALTELAHRCRKAGIWLICDEVYSLITYETPHTSLLKCTTDLSNVIVVDGLSKSHAMSGWRVGWAIASGDMAAALTRYSGAALFGTSQFIQDAAAYALAHDAEDVTRMRNAYRQRRDHVVSHINQAQGLSAHPPMGGMFVMIDVSRIAKNGEVFARGLLEHGAVSVLPGRCFGPSGEHFVRLSLTEDVDVLSQALERIARYADSLTE